MNVVERLRSAWKWSPSVGVVWFGSVAAMFVMLAVAIITSTPEIETDAKREAFRDYAVAVQLMESEYDHLERLRKISAGNPDRRRLVDEQTKRLSRAKRYYERSDARLNSLIDSAAQRQ